LKVSRNEILAQVSRAMEGLFCEIGQYRDAAILAVWLEMRGLGGLAQLLESVDIDKPRLRGEFPILNTEPGEIGIDMVGRSTFIDGPVVLDMLCVNIDRNELDSVELVNCSHPLPLVAYLATSKRCDLHYALRWTAASPETNELLAVIDAKSGEPTLYMWDSPQNFDVRGSSALFLCDRNPASISKFVADTIAEHQQLAKQLSADELTSRYQNSLEHGVVVTNDVWASLKNLGDRVLVADTEDSRIRGAGPDS
jgi:hypothetical protein